MMKKRATLCMLLILCFVFSTFSFPLVNATEDSWVTLEPMPTARSGLGVAVVDGKIYAIGGSNGTHRLDVNEVYDPATDTWTAQKPMPTARSGHATAVYQNKIYVIGGVIGESDPGSSGYTGVNEVYDPVTDTWETMESMPTASANLDANVAGDKIYLICGLKYSGIPPTFTQYADENQVYDPSTDSWSTRMPIPIGNWGYASAVVDNKIHVIGVDLTQIYDPETDMWASGTSSPMLVFSAAAGATVGGLAPKRIYVFGGMYEYSNIASNLTQVYDPEADTWTTGTPMPTPRWGLGVAVVNDELYAIGGKTGEGDNFSAVNEKYTPYGYIPEFPSWIVLPLFVFATLAVIVYRKKLHVVT
jgi:N-acetylneuraminic acid mutarotase